jgi:protein-tyrosine phosphatase
MDTPIADSYWVIPGRLLAGEYPGAPDDASAKVKLQSILDAGVSAFIDLTNEEELRPYETLLPIGAVPGKNSITHDRMPIRDLGVPTALEMSVILDRANTLLEDGGVVYVHCWGGIGRTGTVVGCYMVQEMGMTGAEALASIEELRIGTHDSSRRSPETQEQRDMVTRWGSP